MAYNGYIVRVGKLRKHPNADKLNIATFFGNDTCVGLDVKIGDIGVYFPEDGQLSEEFCEANNLCRKKDAAGNNVGGYMDPVKRNIKAINLRGAKSDGIYLPLDCFNYIDGFTDSTLSVGDRVDIVLGHEICKKYIPYRRPRANNSGENRTRKKRMPISPLFSEHADTEQLAYNLAAFDNGDLVEITLKMHGTSQRTGYLPVFKGYYPDFWGKIANSVDPNKKLGKFAASLYEKALRLATPVYDWGYVSGTRRVVLENYEGGFYGSNTFREQHSKKFEGKLLKGETVYYEVVGYAGPDTPIMGSVSNKKVNDSEFKKKYGDTTVFSYGCNPGESEIYVYRMTMTNEDGDVVEYSPTQVRNRCEQMGINSVPVLWSGAITIDCWDPGKFIAAKAAEYNDGPDPIGKTHVREGVVVRILNKPGFVAFKDKNFSFKVLAGIVKDEISSDITDEDILNEL